MFSFVESFKFSDKDITRRSKIASRAIAKRTLLKAQKNCNRTGKKHVFHHENCAYRKNDLS